MCYTVGIEAPLYLPQVNAAARPEAPVCTMERPRQYRPIHWLLLPGNVATSADAAALKIWLANARIEELERKPLYRPLIHSNRCVVRLLWFYEWRHEGTRRIKYRISLPEGAPLLVPGLWHRTTVDGAPCDSFTLCTMEARGVMRFIHNHGQRQPVVMDRTAAAVWLDEETSLEDARTHVVREELSHAFITDPPQES